MKLIGRLFIVFSTLALAAWGVWTFVFGRTDVQQQLYERAAAERYAAAQPSAAATDFRATVCAASPCLFVEAGGLAFLVGAGQGAAEGLQHYGLLRADLDGVLLSGLDVTGHEGLAGLGAPLMSMGRREALPVFGPLGTDNFVQGANLLLRAPPEAPAAETPPATPKAPVQPKPEPFIVGTSLSAEGPEGALVFDSGVVAVRSFPVAASASDRTYRFDFDKRSLIVAGCSASAADVLAAARGSTNAALVVASSSDWMQAVDSAAAKVAGAKAPRLDVAQCLKPDAALAAMDGAKLSGGLLAPLHPAAVDVPARRMWESLVPGHEKLRVAAGEPGASLQLTADGLVLTRGGKPVVAKKPPAAAKPAAKPTASAAPQKQAGP